VRAAVLRNIVASWREIPHIHIGGELAADGLVEARHSVAARSAERPTVTDLLLLAVARALLDVPELNGTLGSDGEPQRAGRVDLGLAVAAPTGLVAPVVRDVADLGLGAIARERARVVSAAREGRLDSRDLAGATCTLSNLGAFPVDFFAPVVSGPQIALVATGRVVEKPVAIDGMIAVRNRIWVNVAIDHRGADGEAGGRFLGALERRLASLPGSA
jgi:pyruvate dehydrogenase E2 component (dihydrolipoamide acetyltransferase)